MELEASCSEQIFQRYVQEAAKSLKISRFEIEKMESAAAST